MKTATTFENMQEKNLPLEITQNEYLNSFANKMMHLSNDIQAGFVEVEDIEEDYLPAIREFILNITGL